VARTLPFPDSPHEQFDHPPLKAMLGQVRFPAILRIQDLANLADFQEELRNEYPTFQQEQQIDFALTPDGMSAGPETRNVRFSTSDNAWSVVLNPTFLTLEASVAEKYSTYDEFRDRFGALWDIALRHLKPTEVVQQGLRYIDHLEWPDVERDGWARYIQPELLGLLQFQALAPRVQHTLTDVRIDLGDSTFLSFKYGLVPAGPNGAVGFLMDTDCFRQAATSDIRPTEIAETFNRFHDEIHALFNGVLTDDARERFRSGRAG
jgi:uncharacterized protein (TIGR04255 family)